MLSCSIISGILLIFLFFSIRDACFVLRPKSCRIFNNPEILPEYNPQSTIVPPQSEALFPPSNKRSGIMEGLNRGKKNAEASCKNIGEEAKEREIIIGGKKLKLYPKSSFKNSRTKNFRIDKNNVLLKIQRIIMAQKEISLEENDNKKIEIKTQQENINQISEKAEEKIKTIMMNNSDSYSSHEILGKSLNGMICKK
jgi:hypothetical protein